MIKGVWTVRPRYELYHIKIALLVIHVITGHISKLDCQYIQGRNTYHVLKVNYETGVVSHQKDSQSNVKRRNMYIGGYVKTMGNMIGESRTTIEMCNL